MQSLQSVLENKNIEVKTGRINTLYEQIEELLIYLKLPHTDKDVVFVMKCVKRYGEKKLAGIRSFVKDYTNFDSNRWKGLFVWYFKRS